MNDEPDNKQKRELETRIYENRQILRVYVDALSAQCNALEKADYTGQSDIIKQSCELVGRLARGVGIAAMQLTIAINDGVGNE